VLVGSISLGTGEKLGTKKLLSLVVVFLLGSCISPSMVVKAKSRNNFLHSNRRAYMSQSEQKTVRVEVTCNIVISRKMDIGPNGELRITPVFKKVSAGGTGVIFRSYKKGSSYILTAKHVSQLSKRDNCEKPVVFLSSDINRINPMPYEIVMEADASTDLSLIKVNKYLGQNTELAPHSYVGEKLVVFGYPSLYVPDKHRATVSVSEGELATKIFKNSRYILLRFTGSAYSGSSGGPAFDESGRLVGIMSFMIGAAVDGIIIPVQGSFYMVSHEEVFRMLSGTGHSFLLR